jgi:hypothetical protein
MNNNHNIAFYTTRIKTQNLTLTELQSTGADGSSPVGPSLSSNTVSVSGRFLTTIWVAMGYVDWPQENVHAIFNLGR